MKQFYRFLILVFFMSSLLPGMVFAEEQPAIKSGAVILLEENTGSILLEKNSQSKMYPASLTKMATAIYAIENGKLDDIVTISKNATDTEGTSVYLEEGEQVPLKRLLQGLLINSGNDAGVAIAEHLDGSVEAFSTSINKYLQEKIGVKDTHFSNPHGLFEENHYTTAYDLALITKYALQNKVFRDIFGTEELDWDGENWKTTLFSHHLLVKGEIPFEGISGGKTGFVPESRYTLSTSAERGDLSLIAIVLQADQDKIAYEDTVALLEYGFQNFEVSQVEGKQAFIGDKNESYRLDKPLAYTHKKEEETQIMISSKGVLQVIGDDGRQIASKQLKMDIPKEALSTRASVEPIKQSPIPGILMIVLFAIAIFFLVKTIRSTRA
ncbi:D-alanyl-D-alanine carboxypeptidase family protein [Ferdinandcohnia sp. Marseille-Q9671]